MLTRIEWDWETGSKEIADMSQWQSQFNWLEEPCVSPNGETIAAIVNLAEGEFNVCVNGETWETVFDKIWYLRFAPDGRLVDWFATTTAPDAERVTRAIERHLPKDGPGGESS